MVNNSIDLAEVLAMLLPQGLVYDDPAAYAKIADLPIVPWEDIHKLWNNSTSRYKKFQDPTSCRLEHFWWHVWASDRRNLSGKMLARLWQDIATGPTIAPLVGPPRPHPMPHTRSMHESDRTASSNTQDPEGAQHPTASLQEKLSQHNLTPSSSRPPPAHPILKKPRGPSTSGPRPTARFVDVPDSEDDTQQHSSDSQQTGSGSGASQSDSSTKKQPPARSKSPAPKGEKKQAKKFVASKATGKRRPVLPRRQSSQSSTGSVASDTSSKDAKSCTVDQISHQGFLTSPIEDTFPQGQGSFRLPTHDEEPLPSSRTLQERPAPQSSPAHPTIVRTSPQPDLRSASSKNTTSKRTPSPLAKGYIVGDSAHDIRGSPGGSQHSTASVDTQPDILSPGRSANPLGIYDVSGPIMAIQTEPATAEHPVLTNTSEKREQSMSTDPEDLATPSPQDKPGTAPRMARTRSNESKRMSADPVPSSFFKSPSVVGMSTLAVKGGFDFDTPKPRLSEDDLPPLGMLDPDIPKASVLDSKFSPTQPSPTVAPAMARSKSQLTLLLELDKERSERNRSSSGTSSRGGGGKDNGKKHVDRKV